MNDRKYTHVRGDEREKLAAKLKKQYKRGASIRTLAKRTGRSYGFVHRILSDMGVLRPHVGAYNISQLVRVGDVWLTAAMIDVLTFLAAANRAEPTRQIVDSIGPYHQDTVKYALNRHVARGWVHKTITNRRALWRLTRSGRAVVTQIHETQQTGDQ